MSTSEKPLDASAYTLGKQLVTDRNKGWRSLYPIYENGVLLAFLGMHSGWGKSWAVYPLRFATGTTGAFEGFQPDDSTCGGRRYVNSKEAFSDPFTGGLIGRDFSKRKDYKSAVEIQVAAANAKEIERTTMVKARETFRNALKSYKMRVELLEEFRNGRIDTEERLATLDTMIAEAHERMHYMTRQVSNYDAQLGENQP